MGLLLPIALALVALAIPILLFYMLRLRRREFEVSSSLLWRYVLLDRTANAPWQRLRRNLLLLLQLLLLLLLVLTLARPFLYTSSAVAGNVVVILDASASMQATDEEGGASRFDRARQEALKLVDGLGAGQRLSFVWAGPTPYIVASEQADKAGLRDALAGLAPSNGRGDLQGAITLAAGAARQLGDATVVLISDGAFQDAQTPPQVPGRTLFTGVGRSSRNVGITALSLREAPGGPELFAGLYNSGQQSASGLLSVRVDGTLRDSRRVQIGPGGDAALTFGGLPLDTEVVEATYVPDDRAADMLAADDHAWALRNRTPDADVLLVSNGNSFLEKALRLVPGAKLSKTTPDLYSPSMSKGLTVLDGFVPSPAQLPPGNLLLFAPPDSPLVPVTGTLQYPVVGQVDASDPLMRFVDLSGVHLAQAQRIIAPSWARVTARTTTGDPLIIAGENGGRRIAAVAFDLHQSDLPLQVAFPILIANLVQWLQPSASVSEASSIAPGDPVALQLSPEADQVLVTGPNGKQTTLAASGQSASFAATSELGVYSVQPMSKGKPVGEPRRFAVNLFSREESNITPRSQVAFAVGQQDGSSATSQGEVEVWPWVLLAGLLVLSVEWWFYNRVGWPRIALPRRKQHTDATPGSQSRLM